MRVLGALLDMGNKQIKSLADPSAPTDAVNLQFLDAALRGLDWKVECIAGSTANVDLAAPGTTLDGVTLTNPMRVLLKDQTAPEENGVYIWTASGAALTRALDGDTAAELSGSTFTIQQGTENEDRMYRVLTDDTFVLDTDPVTFAQVGGASAPYTGGDGLTLTGQDFNVGAGTGISVNSTSVAIDTAVVSRKNSALISATNPFVQAHGYGSAAVTPMVQEVSTGEFVSPDVKADATNITVTWETAVSANAFRLIWSG